MKKTDLTDALINALKKTGEATTSVDVDFVNTKDFAAIADEMLLNKIKNKDEGK